MLQNKMAKKFILLSLTVCGLLLSGCGSQRVYNQTMNNTADVTERTAAARHKSDGDARPESSMAVNQGLYVDKTPISLSKQPSWLKNRIVIRGTDLPFSYYARTIVNGGGNYILTRYQVGLDPALKISLNYTGTVQGALDLLASRAGYVYAINGNSVYWQAFVTRTFDIAFMPGSSDYMMGKAQGGGGSSSAQGGAQGSTTVNAVVDDSAASQYSNLKATLSVWKDLEASIKELISSDGRVVVSEATTTVTVRDRPSNIALVGKFISNLNKNLSKQVLVKVQVLEVRLTSDFNYGINWNIIQRSFGGGGSNFILNAQEGTPVSITALGVNTALTQAGIKQSDPNARTGYNILVNALTQQGRVSIVSEPRVVCLNNQVSAVRIVSQTGYLASIENTTVGGSASGSSTVTSQITPGTVVTGLTLYILPKIMGNKIFLQVNADLSNNQGLTTISALTGGAAPENATQPNVIQIPNVTQKQFNQRSVISSGDTLILSGFRQVANQTGAMQLFDTQALGGKAATQLNSETIVLITPIILHGSV